MTYLLLGLGADPNTQLKGLSIEDCIAYHSNSYPNHKYMAKLEKTKKSGFFTGLFKSNPLKKSKKIPSEAEYHIAIESTSKNHMQLFNKTINTPNDNKTTALDPTPESNICNHN